ncbi:uncharacterized protein A1O9_11794 [Exophiala aquamarina CBS 119918]|uniref:C6 finger domain-containing protein n=1 Tax=Exophiala aquamarina CBS 119918 TaxID=1182545 RepID=A0A072NXL0_9EURO|nr:uncharacterized protein A1O9_11794 [Exophiala aquamarina CBS 119918]KEF52167.1 hypothetical protein A1O9_11794 [Exophiala aquamarina CBS 119918]
MVERASTPPGLPWDSHLPEQLPYRVSEHEQLLKRFRNRTAFTVSDDKRLSLYQNEIITLARSNPVLMHTILTVTLMHDRFLSPTRNYRRSAVEAYHCYRASTSLQEQLARPLGLAEQAALWTSTALLGIIVFAQLDADTPDEVWPLAPCSTPKVDWVRIGQGKSGVYQITPLLHEDPVFGPLTVIQNPEKEFKLTTGLTLGQLPRPFIRLYGLDDHGTDEFNLYRPALRRLARALDPKCHPVKVVMDFWGFTNMKPEFKALLDDRDPRALLILAYWYMRVNQLGVWWLRPRTVLEGRAICAYLEQYSSDDPDLRSLLQFPKASFGPRDEPLKATIEPKSGFLWS